MTLHKNHAEDAVRSVHDASAETRIAALLLYESALFLENAGLKDMSNRCDKLFYDATDLYEEIEVFLKKEEVEE